MKFLLALTLAVVATADPTKTIVENAIATPALSTLVKVLTTRGYEPVLKALNGTGPFTVFAPSNDAFAAAHIDPRLVPVVTEVLMYHVFKGAVKSTDLAALQFPETLAHNRLFVGLGGKGQVVGVAKNADGVTVNFGIPGVANFTAKVIVADVICSNGVVHVVDKVLLFPRDIARTATEAGLREVVHALLKADLARAVETHESITVFAPTDAAMKAAKWESLDRKTLEAVLKYHVVPAVAYSTSLKDGEQVPTLQGDKLTIKIGADGVMINDAKVVVANALVRNGVVHVIDKVLIPAAQLQE